MRRRSQHTKWRSKPLNNCRQLGLFPDDHPAIESLKAELDQAKAVSDESVPLSKRIRAGQNQIATHERDLKAARERVEEAERSIVAAQKSFQQLRAKAEDIEKALQERRTQLEHLHQTRGGRSVPRSRSHTAGNHVPRRNHQALPQERKAEAAAKEAAAQPTKEGMDIDEFGGLDDQDDPTAEARIQASIDELLQAQTRGDPERLAVLRAQMAGDLTSLVPKKKPKQW